MTEDELLLKFVQRGTAKCDVCGSDAPTDQETVLFEWNYGDYAYICERHLLRWFQLQRERANAI